MLAAEVDLRQAEWRVDAAGLVTDCRRRPAWSGVEVGELLVDRFSPEDRDSVRRALRGEATPPVRFDGRWWVFVQAEAAGDQNTVRAWPVCPWDPPTLASGWSDASASLARELNDSMSIVQGRLELVCEIGGLEPSCDNHLRVALDHAHRISAVLRNLRAIGQGTRDFVVSDTSEIVSGALELVGAKARAITGTGPDTSASILNDPPIVVRIAASLITWVLEQRPQRWCTRVQETEDDVLLTFFGGSDMGDMAPDDGPIAPMRQLLRATAAQAGATRGRGSRTAWLRLMLAPPLRARPRKTDRTLLVVGSTDVHRAISALLNEDGVLVRRAVPWEITEEADLVVIEREYAPVTDTAVPIVTIGDAGEVPSRRRLLSAMGRRARTVAGPTRPR